MGQKIDLFTLVGDSLVSKSVGPVSISMPLGLQHGATLKKSLFPDKRVAKIMAIWAATNSFFPFRFLFFLVKKITEIFAPTKYIKKRKKKKKSSQWAQLYNHPAGPMATIFFKGWPRESLLFVTT